MKHFLLHLVKTWCENTVEGEAYLRFNGYKNVKRIPFTEYFVCTKLGCELGDVQVII